jgi:drug/metabolite transporter (DMT)-like permease
MSSRTKALIAIVAASLLWSTAGITKIPLATLDVFWLAFLRYSIASLVLLPIFLMTRSRSMRSYLPLIPLSFMSTANVILFYFGLSKTTANATSLIYSIVPLTVALLAQRFINEPLTRKRLGGIMVGLLGAAIIIALPVLESGKAFSGNLEGNIIILFAAATWALYTIGSRYAISVKKFTPIEVTAISAFTPAVILAFVAASRFNPSYLTSLQAPGVALIVLYIGICLTVFTFLLYQWGIQNSSATTASLKQYIEPVFGVVFNMIVLGEVLTLGFLIGGALVVAGISLTSGAGLVRELRLIVKKR